MVRPMTMAICKDIYVITQYLAWDGQLHSYLRSSRKEEYDKADASSPLSPLAVRRACVAHKLQKTLP